MNLKQALEDWIGAEETENPDDYPFDYGKQYGRNEKLLELRASLPTLLAKIEQHVLEARKDEAGHYCDEGHYHEQERDIAMLPSERVAELDALLNKGGEEMTNAISVLKKLYADVEEVLIYMKDVEGLNLEDWMRDRIMEPIDFEIQRHELEHEKADPTHSQGETEHE